MKKLRTALARLLSTPFARLLAVQANGTIKLRVLAVVGVVTAAVFVALFGTPLTAQQLPRVWTEQRRSPDEAALIAAYCIPILQTDINRMLFGYAGPNRGPDKELYVAIAEREMMLWRLQRYLLVPRTPWPDASSLQRAVNLAETDMRAYEALRESCDAKCGVNSGKSHREGYEACMWKCSSSALADRLEACRNPTWLPTYPMQLRVSLPVGCSQMWNACATSPQNKLPHEQER